LIQDIFESVLNDWGQAAGRAPSSATARRTPPGKDRVCCVLELPMCSLEEALLLLL
jgi:hypothetical protein